MVANLKANSHDAQLRGVALLDDPIHNNETAFSPRERRQFGLERILLHAVEDLDRQFERVMEHLDVKPNDAERYIHLIGPEERNKTSFYRTVLLRLVDTKVGVAVRIICELVFSPLLNRIPLRGRDLRVQGDLRGELHCMMRTRCRLVRNSATRRSSS